MNEKLYAALNDQVTKEFEAALVYRQLSYEMDRLSLPGMQNWFEEQAAEEIDHANRFAAHLLDRGEKVTIGKIEIEALNINSALDAFEASLAHEKKVSASIRDIARIADEVKDYDSRPLLHEFLAEQIEEEADVSEIVDQLRLVDNEGTGILRLDTSLGQRDD